MSKAYFARTWYNAATDKANARNSMMWVSKWSLPYKIGIIIFMQAVRKKAVMALHRFYQSSPSSVAHLVSNFRKVLCSSLCISLLQVLCSLI